MTILQADLLGAPLPVQSFDFIWCVNTNPSFARSASRDQPPGIAPAPGGRIALGQSSFLPDMYFCLGCPARAAHQRGGAQLLSRTLRLDERDLAAVRGLLGLLNRTLLQRATIRTVVIERTAPLRPVDSAYLHEVIFRQTWGCAAAAYLSPADYAELRALCNPGHPQFALRRPDFHFLQTFTLGVAEI